MNVINNSIGIQLRMADREEAQFILFNTVFGSVLKQNLGEAAIRKVFDHMPKSVREQMSTIKECNVDEDAKKKSDATNTHLFSTFNDVLNEDSYSSSSFSDSEIFGLVSDDK